jgi:ferritin
MAMAVSLRGQPGIELDGFHAALNYESSERWHLSKVICRKVHAAGRSVTIGAQAAPKQDFKSVQEILDYACALEDQTLTTLDAFLKNAQDASDTYSQKCLTDIYMWCVGEAAEVRGLSRMFKMYAGDIAALSAKDD